jgi:hypothetical protein
VTGIKLRELAANADRTSGSGHPALLVLDQNQK